AGPDQAVPVLAGLRLEQRVDPAVGHYSSLGAAAWMAASSSGVAPSSRRLSQYVRASPSVLNAGIGGGVGASGSASTLYAARLPLVAVSAAVKGLSMWDRATTRIPPTCCPPNLTVGSPARVIRLPAHAAASVPHACAMRRRFVLDGLNGRPGYSARWIETRCSLSRSTSVTVTVRGPAT